MSRPPAIVLVRPQLGENIGMAARAMLNCGLDELRLVAPRDGWPNPAARAAAAGADAVIDGARVFDTAAEAVADLQLVLAATARRRDVEKPVHRPREAARLLRDTGARAGVLFGPERSGLDNDEVGLAAAIVEAPLNPDFPSLNLAQAVFLMAWEWRMAGPPTRAAATQRTRRGRGLRGFLAPSRRRAGGRRLLPRTGAASRRSSAICAPSSPAPDSPTRKSAHSAASSPGSLSDADGRQVEG